jgi:hypothetical protein
MHPRASQRARNRPCAHRPPGFFCRCLRALPFPLTCLAPTAASGEGTDPHGYMTAHAAMSSGISAACDVLQTVITSRIKSVLPLQVEAPSPHYFHPLPRLTPWRSRRMPCFECDRKCNPCAAPSVNWRWCLAFINLVNKFEMKRLFALLLFPERRQHVREVVSTV